MNHALIFNLTTMRVERLAGGHRIASFLREQRWDVEVVDWAPYWKKEELHELVRSRVTSSTLFFGFSSFFQHWTTVEDEFVAWLKKEYPNIKILVGGPRLPKTLNKKVDYYIHGYAEYALLEVIKEITGNSSNRLIYDPKYFGQGNVIAADTSYPAAPMKSAPVIYEDRDYILPNEWLTIEFSRGCKFKCAYCNYSFLGVKEDFTRLQTDIEHQLKDAYDRFGVTHYTVVDETFNDTTEKVKNIADVIEGIGADFWFSGFVRADLLVSRPEDKEHLARMNFFGQFYGIESMNRKTGQIVGKGMDPNRLLPGILDIKKYFQQQNKKYRGTISLIVGLPYETEDTFSKSFQWLVNNWQGENVLIFPLLIAREGNALMTQDWQKYGYREVEKSMGTYSNFPKRNDYFEFNICWENDYMDLPTAYRIADQYITKVRQENDFRIASFHFPHVVTTFDDIFSVTNKMYDENLQTINQNNDIIIKDYITKKLNR